VPDEVTNAIVRDRLAQPDAASGFLLDGYPRTEAQVAELDDMLTAAGTSLDGVLELTVDVDEVVQRLLKRAETDGRATTPKTSSGTASRSTKRRRRRLPPSTANVASCTRLDGMGASTTSPNGFRRSSRPCRADGNTRVRS
jgi:adenylate kinase